MDDTVPFVKEFEFEYGKTATLTPRIRRVVARNPGPFTFHGTGTYILGRGRVAVVDPGPVDEKHLRAILAATRGEVITHILVTHTHRDHSPGCRPLRGYCDAKTYGFGPHGAGQLDRDAAMGKGADLDFEPDVLVGNGEIIQGGDWSIECVHTPGHTSNHMCFQVREEKALLTGDHIMAWSTSVISPPDGDMGAYVNSLSRLLERNDEIYWPAHGGAIENPKPFVKAFIRHRERREQQILACIRAGKTDIARMVPAMYEHLPPAMFPAASRSVYAALVFLVEKGELAHPETLDITASFELAR